METPDTPPVDREEQDFLSGAFVQAREEAVRQHREVRARLSRLLGSEFLLVHLPRMTWQSAGSPYYYGEVKSDDPEAERSIRELMAFSSRVYEVFNAEMHIGAGTHRFGLQVFDSRRVLSLSWLGMDRGPRGSAREILRPILIAGGAAVESERMRGEDLPAVPAGPPNLPRLSALLQRGLP